MTKYKTIWNDSELRWSIEEMLDPQYKKQVKKLMGLVSSKKPFDIGWVGLKKEIVSFNIKREKPNGRIILSVSQSMDELPYDLIYDADLEGELSDEDIDAINEDDEYTYRLSEVYTDWEEKDTLPTNCDIKDISDMLMRLWNKTDKHLKDDFEVVKEIVKEYKDWKKTTNKK